MLILMCMMLSSLLVGTNYTAIVPFYPTLAQQQGLGPAAIGLVLAAMPLGSLVSSPYIARNLHKLGKVNALILSVALTVRSTQALSSFALAVSLEFEGYFAHSFMFGLVGFSARLLSGFSLSLNSIASFSIICSDYSDILEKAIAYVELVASLGYSLGLVVLTALNSFSGPQASFLIYGSVFAVSSLPFMFLRTSTEYTKAPSSHISAAELLSHPVSPTQPVLCVVGALLLVSLAEGGLDVLLALYLEELGESAATTAEVYSLCSVSYLCFAVVPSYIPQSVPRQFIILAGLMASSFAYVLIGSPCFLPKSLWSIGLGVFMVGVGYAFVYSKP